MRSRSAAIVTIMTVLLSGCGLISSPDRAVPAGYVERSTITQAAIALVGEARASQAADEATTFALATSFQPRLLDPAQDAFTAEELNSASIQDALAPGTLSLWKQLVVQAAEGNSDAQEEVRGLEMFALRQPTWQVNPDGKIVHSQAISNVVVDVLTADAAPAPEATEMLKVSFTHEARLRYTEDKHPFEVVFTRAVEYHLVPANSVAGRTVPNKITVVTATPAIPAKPRPATDTSSRAPVSQPTSSSGAKPVVTVPPDVSPTTTAKPSASTTKASASPTKASASPTKASASPTKTATTAPPTTAPPTTQPPTTAPPTTAPPTTEPPPATEPPATEPPATEPPATQAPTDAPARAVNAFLFPLEVDVALDQSAIPSMTPSVSPTTSRMWQIAVYFGAYEVDTVELPR